MAINYKKAVKQAKKELEKEAIEEIKEYIKDTLQAIEDKKASIKKRQAELKALKADLKDLEQGRLKQIRKRQEKDKVARRVSKVNLKKLTKEVPSVAPYVWDNITSGSTNLDVTGCYTTNDISDTYLTTCSNGSVKAYYI